MWDTEGVSECLLNSLLISCFEEYLTGALGKCRFFPSFSDGRGGRV